MDHSAKLLLNLFLIYGAAKLLAEDLPLIFLYFSDALPVVSSRVHGIDPGPNGIRYRSNLWFVPKLLQRYTAG